MALQAVCRVPLCQMVRRLVVVLLVAGETIGRSAGGSAKVAIRALAACMRTVQRKACSSMVERRRYPRRSIVAILAGSPNPGSRMAWVRSIVVIIGMARSAICWRACIARGMAGSAFGSNVCACQWEVGSIMVEGSIIP